MKKGILFLVVGNSGSGKDAVITWVTKHCDVLKGVKRIITRPESKRSEDFISIAKHDFCRNKYFLEWEVYEKLYGIKLSILKGLEQGNNYIVNISRSVIKDAFMKWPNCKLIEMRVPIDILKQRLIERGRESLEEIEKRINRAKNAPKLNPDIIIDTSNSDVSIAGKVLLDYINSIVVTQ